MPHSLAQLIEDRSWDACLERLRTELGRAEAAAADPLGRLPIHTACEWSGFDDSASAIASALLSAHPGGAAAREFALDRLPLHCLCAYRAFSGDGKGRALAVLSALLEAHPEAAAATDARGRNPLHYASEEARGPSAPGAVRVLLDAHPDGAKECDLDGRLPIHCACGGDAGGASGAESSSPEVIGSVLTAYPDGAGVSDQRGRLPLHCAVDGGADAETVRSILEAYPAGVERPDGKGFIPLQLACRRGACLEVVRLLLEACHDTVKRRYDASCSNEESSSLHDGMLPLHFAATCGDAALDVVQFMLELYPEAARTPDAMNMLPLHNACFSAVSSKSVLALLKEYPEGVEHSGNIGRLPLHVACQGSCLETFQVLVDAYPDAIGIESDGGKLPIHWACETGKFEVVLVLLEMHPEGIEKVGRCGNLPLHMLCERGDSSEAVFAALKAYPHGACIPDNAQNYPLHLWCSRGRERILEAFKALFEAYRDGARKRNHLGEVPLHCACRNGRSPEVVQALISEFPEGARMPDSDQHIPLHHACEGKAAIGIISSLLREYPESCRYNVSSRYKPGETPLQWAAQHCAPPEILHALLEANPDGIRATGRSGELVLHRACRKGVTIEALLVLLDAYPAGISEPDFHGNLPLHWAANTGAGVDVVRTLLKKYPDAVRRPNHSGDLPLHCACEQGGWLSGRKKLAVVRTLLESHPDGIRKQNKNGELPLHLLCKNVDAAAEELRALIRAYPEATKLKTNSGSLPLNYKCRQPPYGIFVLELLKAYPEAASIPETNGQLPVHDIIRHCHMASPEVIAAVIKAFPEGATRPSYLEGKNLPIHTALKNRASDEIVRILFDAYPDCAGRQGQHDMLPLHQACHMHARYEVVKMLLEANPDGACAADSCGRDWLPLHHACAEGAPDETISLLLKYYPEAAAVTDDRGDLPVHLLSRCYSIDIQKGKTLHVSSSVERLLHHIMGSKAACRAIGNFGSCLPLHIAAIHNVSGLVFDQLLTTYPEAAARLFVKPGASDVYALDLLEKWRSPEVPEDDWRHDFNLKSDNLFSFNPHVLPLINEVQRLCRVEKRIIDEICTGGKLSKSGERIWIWLCESDHHDKNVKRIMHALEVVTAVKLASIKTRTGQPIMVAASPKCGRTIRSFLLFVGRYEIMKEARPLHQSATCIVLRAKDYGSLADTPEQFPVLFSGESKRCVVIKFMRSRHQYKLEKLTRKGLRPVSGQAPPLVPYVDEFDEDRIGTDQEKKGGEGDLRFKEDRLRFSEADKLKVFELQKYRYALVMPEADRTLDDIYRHERPSINEIRGMMDQLGRALQILHENGIVHGDFKLQNAVRLNGRFSLIDMDSSCVSDECHCDDAAARIYAGMKFSSGTLPPEMIVKLDTNGLSEYNMYWEALREANVELWKKVKPRLDASGCHGYAVKAFNWDICGGTGNPLPYSLVRATEKLDVWSFGVVLFILCSCDHLFKVNRDDDLSSWKDFHSLWNWNSHRAADVVSENVEDPLARDLLMKLLAREEDRIESMSRVLEEPFFAPQNHGMRFDDIKDGAENSLTVLLSDPLVWKDIQGNTYPIEVSPNVALERDLITQCVSETGRDIKVLFDVATVDRLQATVMRHCSCLHFSGHGHPSALLLEDGFGGALWVESHQLRNLLHPHTFKFAFVSACFSDMIGQALVEAGIRHVVCVEHDAELRDDVAIKFTQSLYFSLFEGCPVDVAFGRAKGIVSALFGTGEMEKFRLLPQDEGHDVSVFNASLTHEQNIRDDKRERIPEAPGPVRRRNVDLFDLFQQCCIHSHRLVLLVGEEFSCRSLALALCSHAYDRITTLSIEEIYFVRSASDGLNGSDSYLKLLLEQLVRRGKCGGLGHDATSREISQCVFEALRSTRALVTFDYGVCADEHVADLIKVFFDNTNAVRLLLVMQRPIPLPPQLSAKYFHTG